jgi:hypothetical protein
MCSRSAFFDIIATAAATGVAINTQQIDDIKKKVDDLKDVIDMILGSPAGAAAATEAKATVQQKFTVNIPEDEPTKSLTSVGELQAKAEQTKVSA